MTLAVRPQASRDYALAKIERVYATHQALATKKRLRVLRRRRRELLKAKAAFHRALDQAISPQLQAGLGIKITVEQMLPRFRFAARFEFLGKQWVITGKKNLLAYQWQISGAQTTLRCTTRNLEHQLCCALGQYQSTSRSSRIRSLFLKVS